MIRKFAPIVFILLAIVSCKQPETGFVKVNGLHFEVNGHPYNFIGVNMFYAAYLGATPEGKLRLVKELDTLKSMGVDNIRLLGSGEASSQKAALPLVIQGEPGKLDENLLRGLDFALAEMGKRQMYAVIYLNNYWNWSGGMAQYVAWATNEKAPDPDVTMDYKTFMNYSASFYTNSKAQTMYRTYIHTLLNRTNVYTGKAYKDEPAIMSWQLANEPRPGPDGDNDAAHLAVLAAWVDSSAAYIHSLDRNHLVSSGSEGLVGCVHDTAGFLAVHASKFIDYANFHMWAKNWGWYNAKNHSATYSKTEQNAISYVNAHIALARQLGKPITLEEFGLDRDSCFTAIGSSVLGRDMYFKKVFQLAADSLVSGSPLVGINVWAWGGYGVPAPVSEVMNHPASFLGDPFGEAQGLNSVYASDTSTVKILMHAATAFKSAGR